MPTITIQPDGDAGKDVTVAEVVPDYPIGTENPDQSVIGVGIIDFEGTLYEAEALLQFDISSIPSDMEIVSASLELRVLDNETPSSDVDLHQITSSWSEATVTWNTKPTYNATIIDTETVEVETVGTWDITDLVAAWYAGTAYNYGVLLKSDDTFKVIAASENETALIRPKLVIEYTEPSRIGGSESTVTVTAEGAGVKAASGASETTVTVGVESGGEAYFVMPPEITIEQVGSKIRLSW